MKKSSIVVLLICNLFAITPLPPYTEEFKKETLEVLEVNTQINWENSGKSDEDAFEYCKNTQSLPKNKKQMEQYLKQHIIVWSLHYYSGFGCAYSGKVKFAGKIWDFLSVGGITRLVAQDDYIALVCVSAKCQPRAWSDEE